MKKPVLVIMAAGMGSRYGGLKQIDPIDEQNHIIMDFSLYDAVKAGFEKVIFIIKKENEAEFKEVIGDRVAKHIEVVYVFQDLYSLPAGYQVPEGRTKPWGTTHAVLSAMDLIDGPFAVINADDYYGANAFKMIYSYLMENQDTEKYQYAMVGYILENTLTDNGHVARGVCETDENNCLLNIAERTRIEKRDEQVMYTEDEGATWVAIPQDSTVSMNIWGFTRSFLEEAQKGFPQFLDAQLPVNPLKCEYFLPIVVETLLKANKAVVKVLTSSDKWHGVTYKEDKPAVVKAIQELKEQGVYPERLWD